MVKNTCGMCIINIYGCTHICTFYITALLSLQCSGTQASDVQAEQTTGNALPSILPIPPINGKQILCINIYNYDISTHCRINLWNIY